jgi:PKD repeat protein
VRYTFEKNDHSDAQKIAEKLIIEWKKPTIQAILKVESPSDYAPVVIHFDGSASETKEGIITKFLYDFWDGKTAEGDAIKDHRYLLAGQYTVTFTVIRNDGVKSSVSKNIILKKKSNQLVLNTSISEWSVGRAISFDAQGSQGQILDFFWDFGDGTTATDASPSHTYDIPWSYVVTLRVTYDDSSEWTISKTIVVRE